MTKIKICGLTRIEDVEAVNQSHPDYVGFVFAKSKRQLTIDKAADLVAKLRPDIDKVGVFGNEKMDSILKICQSGVIDIVQLHGDEPEEDVLRLKEKGICVLRALRVKTISNLARSNMTVADYPLLDTYHPERYGGTGESFDWSDLCAVNRPFFLAGGISCENVKEAIRTGAYCLDVSSGAETNGVKDPEKIAYLCRIVHASNEIAERKEEHE